MYRTIRTINRMGKGIIGLKGLSISSVSPFSGPYSKLFLPIRLFSSAYPHTAPPIEPDSFFQKHIGKFILTGISSIVFFIWRWVQKRYDAIAMEERVEEFSFLNPHEMNELGRQNRWSFEETHQIIEAFNQENDHLSQLYTSSKENSTSDDGGFSDGDSSAMYTTYQQFVAFLSQHLTKPIQNAYMWDRMVLGATRKGQSFTLSPFPSSLANILSKHGKNVHETLEREEMKLAQYMHEFYLLSLLPLTSCSLEEKVSLIMQIYQQEEEQEEQLLSHEQLTRLTTFLKMSFQLPSAVQVVKTEDFIPYQQHREAVGFEIVKNGLEEMEKMKQKVAKENKEKEGHRNPRKRQKSQEEGLTYYDQEEIMLFLKSRDVCAWGECYRR